MATSPIAVKRVQLGSQALEVSALGLGCMSMSSAYGPPKDDAEMIKLILHAVSLGVTFLDTADIYGSHITKSWLERRSKAYVKRCRLQPNLESGRIRVARVAQSVVIQSMFGEVKKLVGEGKVKYGGLSEASASEIRRAYAVHPITAVQIEWPLWVRDVENGIIPLAGSWGLALCLTVPLGVVLCWQY